MMSLRHTKKARVLNKIENACACLNFEIQKKSQAEVVSSLVFRVSLQTIVDSTSKGAKNNTIKKEKELEKPIQGPAPVALPPLIGFSSICQNLDKQSVPNFIKYKLIVRPIFVNNYINLKTNVNYKILDILLQENRSIEKVPPDYSNSKFSKKSIMHKENFLSSQQVHCKKNILCYNVVNRKILKQNESCNYLRFTTLYGAVFQRFSVICSLVLCLLLTTTDVLGNNKSPNTIVDKIVKNNTIKKEKKLEKPIPRETVNVPSPIGFSSTPQNCSNRSVPDFIEKTSIFEMWNSLGISTNCYVIVSRDTDSSVLIESNSEHKVKLDDKYDNHSLQELLKAETNYQTKSGASGITVVFTYINKDKCKFTVAMSGINTESELTQNMNKIKSWLDNFFKTTVYKKGTVIAKIPVVYGTEDEIELKTESDINVILSKKDSDNKIRKEISHRAIIQAPSDKNLVIGTIALSTPITNYFFEIKAPQKIEGSHRLKIMKDSMRYIFLGVAS